MNKAVVVLEGLEFFAYHGVYEAERSIGNKYGVDIKITLQNQQNVWNDSLSETVDYEKVYKIIKKQLENPVKLLETIASKIIDQLFSEFQHIKEIEISVSKFNPPVGGICKKATAILTKSI